MIYLHELPFGTAYSAVIKQLQGMTELHKKYEFPLPYNYSIYVQVAKPFYLKYTKKINLKNEILIIESSSYVPQAYTITYYKLNSIGEHTEGHPKSRDIEFVMKTLRREFNLQYRS